MAIALVARITLPLAMLRILLALPVAALAAVALTGCTEKKIDTSKAERSIKAGIENRAGRDVGIASVSCPDDVEVKKGERFDCTIKGTNGKTAKVTVVQRDDKGNVTYSGDLSALVQR
jgi:hypothetical protein